MSLSTALDELLRARLPGLLGGASPPVSLAVERAALTVEALPRGAADAEPRSHDGFDLLPLNAAGPYTVTQPPAAGPRRVWLQGDLGRITLRENEVSWDGTDPRKFTIDVAGRDLTGLTHVGVRYSVTAVRTTLQAVQVVRILLSASSESAAGALEGAEALVLAVLALELAAVTDASAAEYVDGDYSASVTTEAIELSGTPAPPAVAEAGERVVEVRARSRFEVGRALHDDEGQPIERVHTPGQPVRPGHPVDVRIDVDA
jgi:hypothetical protein